MAVTWLVWWWVVDGLVGWSVGILICRSVCWSVGRSVGPLVNRSAVTEALLWRAVGGGVFVAGGREVYKDGHIWAYISSGVLPAADCFFDCFMKFSFSV